MSLSDAIEEFLAHCKQDSHLDSLQQADLTKLQHLTSKEKLDDQDILFLKENLPANMFESFILEKATHRLPFKSPTKKPLNPEETEDDLESQMGQAELSIEFMALKKEMERKLQSPVILSDQDRLEYIGRGQTQHRQDIFRPDAIELCTRNWPRNTIASRVSAKKTWVTAFTSTLLWRLRKESERSSLSSILQGTVRTRKSPANSGRPR